MSRAAPAVGMGQPSTFDRTLSHFFGKKVKDGLFSPVRCALHGRADAEDRLQEGIAQTWVRFLRHFDATGETLPDAVLVAFCRRRAISRRDFIVKRRRAKYALDLYDALERRGELGMLISEDTVPLSEHTTALEGVIDAERYFTHLPRRTRSVVVGLIRGVTYAEIASVIGTSSSTVSRIVSGLRSSLGAYSHG